MERKASFSVEAPKANSSKHNDRTQKPKYLIEPDPNFSGNFYKKYGEYKDDEQYREYAQNFYKKKVGQKMQPIQIPAIVKEAVITLKEDHTEKDVLALFDKLNSEYGGHQVLEMAIHHDEGHFEDVHGNTFYPNTDIFYNEKDENWYFEYDKKNKEFLDRATMLTKVFNYHAHVKFTMMDKETARTPQMPKAKMSSRHKVVADHLGLRHAPGQTRFQKKGINQVKAEHHDNKSKIKSKIKEIKELHAENFTQKVEISQLEEKLQAKGKVAVADLNKLKEAYRKEMIVSELYYTKEDYQKLNALFVEAKELNKSKDLDLADLQKKVSTISDDKTKYKAKNIELEADLDKAKDELKKKDAQIASYESKLSDKAQEIEVLEDKVSLAAQTISEQEKTIKTLTESEKQNQDQIKQINAEAFDMDMYVPLAEFNDLAEKHNKIFKKHEKVESAYKALNTKYSNLKELYDKVVEFKNELLVKVGLQSNPLDEKIEKFKLFEVNNIPVVAESEFEALKILNYLDGEKVTKVVCKDITSIKPDSRYTDRAKVNGVSTVKVSERLKLDFDEFQKVKTKEKTKKSVDLSKKKSIAK